ncbi:M20/M25/M40 family metallo-hydrolase [bacterium]|nr:M20/M25/M40 family metallo-hydrolase [bacterium]
MDLKEIRKEHELVDLFCNLAQVPSPSLHEENVSKYIIDYCKENNIPAKLDDYGNVLIDILPTDDKKDYLLLSAHMDVIGDDSKVETYVDDNNCIHAKGRTLGADDKAGVANALLLAKEVANSNISHGGLECVFTRDEESGMSGIRHLKFADIKSKYALVCDSDTLGQLEVAGASYTLVTIKLHSLKSGHSGIDIGDRTRANAAKLIADLISELPQGAYYEENGKVVTSCNLGGIQAGNIKVTNIINPEAAVSYSIRSSSRNKEEELHNIMKNTVEKFQEKNKHLATVTIEFEEHLPPFEKVDDNYIPILFEAAAKKVDITPDITTFHAGAETHIYANNTNCKGEKFVPYLVGLATVCNMHTKDEYVDYKTMLKGHELLKEFFRVYNN